MIVMVGQEVTATHRPSLETVRLFAQISGDSNPLHVDPVFAAKTQFGVPIVPGILMAAWISGALATHMPGPGTIYLSQTLRFVRAVPVGDLVEVRLRVVSTRPEKAIATIETIVTSGGENAAVGEAVVKYFVDS